MPGIHFQASGREEKVSRGQKACTGCLLIAGTDNDCKKRWRCKVGDCGANHNKLLHEEKKIDAKVAHAEGNQDANAILQIQEI